MTRSSGPRLRGHKRRGAVPRRGWTPPDGTSLHLPHDVAAVDVARRIELSSDTIL